MISVARTLALRPSFLSLVRPSSSIVRLRHALPINWGVVFVPQQEAWVVERMGRFNSILDPGLNFLVPLLDRISYVQSLKEIAIDIPKQSAVTSDNVSSLEATVDMTQLRCLRRLHCPSMESCTCE